MLFKKYISMTALYYAEERLIYLIILRVGHATLHAHSKEKK